MFEGDKWAKQTAIVVLIHAAAWMALRLAGMEPVESFFISIVVTSAAIAAIHRSKGNQMFKNMRWQDEALVTVSIMGLTSFFMSAFLFPVTLGITYAAVWYVRKKTGGDKKPIPPIDDVKIGSPF